MSKKKILAEPKYAGFQIRATAVLIDCFLASIILIPLFGLFSQMIFGDVAPNEVIDLVNNEAKAFAEADPNFNTKEFFLNNQQIKDYFIVNNGLLKVLLNQVAQVMSLLLLFYVFWIKKQATPGKMFLSLKIVDAKTFGKPSKKQFFIRLIGIIISALPLTLGMLWIAIDKKKQGWHDKMAGTVVIQGVKNA